MYLQSPLDVALGEPEIFTTSNQWIFYSLSLYICLYQKHTHTHTHTHTHMHAHTWL
jgi:hypothetical protein